jgi:hypothetical protein
VRSFVSVNACLCTRMCLRECSVSVHECCVLAWRVCMRVCEVVFVLHACVRAYV